MRSLYSFFTLIVLLVLTCNTSSTAQLVGDNTFFQGQFLEVGIAPNGSLGSTRNAPSGYYPYAPGFTLWDPALGSAATSTSTTPTVAGGALAMVYDAGHDGWTTGTPFYFGDYTLPGDPYEGWGVEINGTHSEAQFEYYESSSAVTGFQGGTLTGAPVSYTNSGGHFIAVWKGSAASGQLQITQVTQLDTAASWVVFSVTMVNTGTTPLTNVYYLRACDPDNDSYTGGSATTTNVINYQNDYAHRVMVTAAGTHYTLQTLSILTKDCRAKCFIEPSWPIASSASLATLYAGTSGAYVYSGSDVGDYAMGIVWNIGTIAPGDSTKLNYAYAYDGLLGTDSAIANPELVTLGSAHDSTDTVTACIFSGDTLYADIINGNIANWLGSTWTWAPSTYLLTTTGTSNAILASTLTAEITYTITGTNLGYGSCATKTFLLTVLPPTATPPPTVHDTSFCQGAVAGPITACAIGSSVKWYTTLTGGIGTTTAPTPSTATIGTITYYVTQTIAGCESAPRVPVNVTIIPDPLPIGGPTLVCPGSTITLTDGTAGGTWSSGATSIATVVPGTGVVTGVTASTVTISYSVSSGCSVSKIVTVTAAPTSILGITHVCSGTSITLADAGGGTWTSRNLAVATVVTGTGVVWGVSAGTDTIVYSLGTGCSTSGVVTVNASPPAITGPGAVCVNSTIPLADSITGGVWSSGISSIATVVPATGVVTGVSGGVVNITYTAPGGCFTSRTITVNPLPVSILGSAITSGVCVGSCSPLFDGTPGGTWTSSNPSVATVGATGAVCGVTPGTSTITYTLPTGCLTTTSVFVNPLPATITGTTNVCIGSTATLSDATGGGTWVSGSTGIATIDPISGVYTGVSSGTATISYILLSTSCISTITVTVAPVLPIIVGPSSVCVGGTATLTDIPGGTWSSSAPGIATVGLSTGIVTGLAIGPALITYTSPSGCTTTAGILVRALPPGITGTMHVCVGQTTILSDASAPGTPPWASSNPAIATVGATGIVGGVSAGVDTITYNAGTGCSVFAYVTVNSTPGPIAGIPSVCIGSTTALTDAGGGTCTSSIPTQASVILGTGVVSGLAAGTPTITYSLGGTCVATLVVTVNPLPPAIAGVTHACVNATTTLSDPAGPGTWSSSVPAVATVGSTSGTVFGVSTGITVITYTPPTGCSRTTTVNINPLPAGISGSLAVCSGSTTILTDSVSGGTWSTSSLGTAGIGSTTGVVTGGTPGTATITYKISATGCAITAVVTVNPLPGVFTVTGGGGFCAGSTGVHIGLSGSATGVTYQLFNGTSFVGPIMTGTGSVIDFGIITAGGTYTVIAKTVATGCTRTMTGGATVTVNPIPMISGATAVCVGATILCGSSVACGTWSSSNPANATVSSTGGVTGLITGTSAVITFTSCAGCIGTTTVNVSPSPGPITGPASVCVGSSGTETDAVTGGLWTSSAPSVATVNSGGTVFGLTPGTTIITYSLGTGCTVTRTVTITPAPGAIGGPTVVCSGTSITLTDVTGGGTWSSSSTAIATVNLTTGSVLGRTAGVVTITYTVGGCTSTTTVTVNFAPGPIAGPGSVCAGSFITLTDSITGGKWTSSSPAIATVDSTTGILTGINPGGTATVTYSVGGSCVVTKVITVDPLSPIGGSPGICVGATTLLTDLAPGGTWSSGTPGVATVNLTTGLVTGVVTGTTLITYTTPAGCRATVTVTVNTAPVAITGVFTVCAGGDTTLLTDAVGGGTWTSSAPGIATAGLSSGIVTGVAPGTAIITYSLGSGCIKTAVVTVNPLPSVTVSSSRVCSGSIITLGPVSITGGTWTSINTTIATINPATGAVTGRSPGIDTVTYTVATGCSRSIAITINPLPSPISGSTTICEGTTVTFSDGIAGGTWSSSSPSIAAVGVTSGNVTAGSTPGTAIITYTIGTGCTVSVTVTVIAPPPAISGPLSVCVGQAAILSDSTPGGTWSSANPAVATIVSGTGVIFGVSSGTVVVFYTVGTGCAVPTTIIVNPLSPIIGDNVICMGQTTMLTDTTDDGIWSSSAASTASVVSTSRTTGLAYGISSGTAVITYTLPTGCYATHPVTVNAAPPAISGVTQVCLGSTTSLSDPGGGVGSWSSSDPGTASVDGSGVVTGLSVGVATITFINTTTTCPATINVTVNPQPAPIAAPANVCIGSIADLTDLMTGGTWTSSDATIATAGLTSGHVGGVSFGSVTVTYTLPTGCSITTPLNVDTLPSPITGNLSVCVGSTTILSDASPAGIWISSNPAAAPISSGGVVSGLTPGVIVPEHYLLSATGCVATAMVTVDALPSTIAPSFPTICQGAILALSDFSTGGTWMSSDNTVATIDSSTGHALGTGPGSATITYTIGTGCVATTTVVVNAAPDSIVGSAAICNGTTITLTDATAGGSWTSSNTIVATVDGTGDVSGIALGTSAISYMVAGCPAILNVTVNPLPDAITGPGQVCQNSTITLGDGIGGGTWSSSDNTIATVDLRSGVLTGVSGLNTVDITYSLGAGCTTFTTVTVNAIPQPIGGSLQVCAFRSTILFDLTGGGSWTSGSIAVATVDAGVVYGITAGTAGITYELGTGCLATAIVTVNAAPSPIIGSPNICFGTPNTYLDTISGGIWSSSAPAVATIDSVSGLATGITFGGATITYVFGACNVTKAVNVYPLPSSFDVTGGGSYCADGIGVHIGLDSSVTGVNYVLYRGVTATGTFAGTGDSLDFGLQTVAGSYTVEAISTATTCSSFMSGSALVTVIPAIPPAVNINSTPGDTVCAGTSTTFTAIPVYGGTPAYQWSVNGTNVSTAGSYTFIPANGDIVEVIMTSTGACAGPTVVNHSVTLTVNPFKNPGVGISASPDNTVCQGTLVSFTAVPSFGGTTPVYTWFENGTARGTTGATYSYVPANGDSIRVIMASNYECIIGADTVSSAEMIVNVDSPMLPRVSINASPGTSIGNHQFDTLSAVVANGGVFPIYQWYLNGYPVAGGTTATYVSNNFELTREDSVSCQVTSDAQCPATSYNWVYINSSNVSVKQIGTSGNDISVIPNPNKGEFVIRGTLGTTKDQEVSLEITDMLGQVVYRNKVMAQSGKINEKVTLSGSLANGMYMLSLHSDSENQVFHIVIEQ